MDEFINSLFKTGAFKFDESHVTENGVHEPYIINTKYLFGSKEEYEKMQQFIDNELKTESKSNIPLDVFEKVMNQYDNNELYKASIDYIRNWIETNVNLTYVDYISGGESADWYFSIILAYLLGKPHMTIYRDGTVVVTTSDFEEGNEVNKVEDARIMHISDVLNKGYFHCNYWFTAIRNIGSDVFWSISIVDLKEGGIDRIKEFNAEPLCLFQANENIFVRGLELGYLTGPQFSILRNYALNSNKF